MAESSKKPTNRDIMNCMKVMTEKLATMEKSLGAIDSLDRKVSAFESELNKIWLALDERAKRTEEKVMRLEDKVDSTDIGIGLLDSCGSDMEKRRQQ
ncbi:hypothetical protein DPMN_010200 [Dreissena polymorpha]|uniref:Uncharacterized protein n=1 Tax=Dreissena polymorpha TaxID=45954 RepID=A0A9D4RYW9_DREPO|nr:hypothetical protein DPMN_010200 [Dreissena polymorpha]